MPSPHCGPRYFIAAVVMLLRFACGFRRIRATADTLISVPPKAGPLRWEGVIICSCLVMRSRMWRSPAMRWGGCRPDVAVPLPATR
jgi:hypothetical protein